MSKIENVIRKCHICNKEMLLKAEDWKSWWEKGGKTPDIMLTSPVECDDHDEDEEDDDDSAWQSEDRLRRMEGWIC